METAEQWLHFGVGRGECLMEEIKGDEGRGTFREDEAIGKVM